jgi:drug/metabolite transporter (DMT)-like permease
MLFLSLSQTALPMTLIFWAEQYVTAGLSAVLYATMPFFVAIFAHFLPSEERLSTWNLSGMLLSFAGVVMLFSGELSVDQYSYFGGFALVVAAGISACGIVAGKKYSGSIDPTANIAVQMGVGALILTTGGVLFESITPLDFNLASMVSILYLGVIASPLGFAAMYWLFGHMEATRLSLLTFITPIVAIVLGWLILGEQVDPNAIVSSSLIILGLMVSKKAGQRHLLRITPT